MATTAGTFDINSTQAWVMRPQSRIPAWVRALLKNPVSITGVVLIIAFALVAIFAQQIVDIVEPVTAQQAVDQNTDNPYRIPRDGYFSEPSAPSANHPFGTAEGQYDIFYGVVWGTRTAFIVGIVITGLTLIVGLIVGTVSAYYGGIVDEMMQRIVEIFLAFPFLLAAITAASVFGPVVHNGILTGIIALTLFGWPGYARLVRGDVLSIKERDFVLAARAIGVRDLRMMMRHILPNAMYSVLVVASLDIGTYVLSFAALSFLGVGAEVGYADWGQLLSFARNWIPSLAKYWFIIVYPGIALLLYVLSWNLIGDAFRDALDPKLRGLRGG
jgi:peptide/nickel transport system permease protein